MDQKSEVVVGQDIIAVLFGFTNIEENKTKSNHKDVSLTCDYKATQRGDLMKHTNSIHKGVSFSCDQCNYKTAQNSNLFRHIESKHEGLKFKFPCDQCDYRAKQKFNLMRHMKYRCQVYL